MTESLPFPRDDTMSVVADRRETTGRDQVSKEWADAKAPTLADFEALAAEAWEKLPAEFRAMSGDLLIRVEDFATEAGVQMAARWDA